MIERKAEIKTLEVFYQGSDTKKRDGGLFQYLQCGLWAIKAGSAVGIVPPIVGTGVKVAEKIGSKVSSINDLINSSPAKKADIPNRLEMEQTDRSPEPRNFDEVAKEINIDLIALKEYLKHSVFYAAGFITYCQQELERIRKRFNELEVPERQWMGIIRTAVKYERNNKIPYKIASRKQDFRRSREIAIEIKEIRDIYSDLC